MSFKSLGLAEQLVASLVKENLLSPTPIQTLAIPAILEGKDLLALAPTGSGKTAAFVLPLLMQLEKASSGKNRNISCLILAPTRELAQQIYEVVKLFSSALNRTVKSMVVYGGVSINPQMIGMQQVEILVATPGRLLDLLENNALGLRELKYLVLDEADKLLNLGFQKELEQILKLVPTKTQRLLFSATLSADLEAIKNLVLKDPVHLEIAAKPEEEVLIEELAYKTTEIRKGPFLRYLLKQETWDQVLIFVSSAKSGDKLVLKLNKNGIAAQGIHGKLSQDARTQVLKKFKNKELRVLVATDLLSRGIDIQELPCVINYELPRSPKDFVHRVGRTGRAGVKGLAISLITEEEEQHFKVIQKKRQGKFALIETADINLHGF